MTTAMSALQEQQTREHLVQVQWPTKRNKRKDFKPRCAPVEPGLPSTEENIHKSPQDDVEEEENDLDEDDTHKEDESNECVKIGVKNLVLLKSNDVEAVNLSGRRISTDSNENIDSAEFLHQNSDAGQEYDYVAQQQQHHKRMEAFRSLNVSSQFQQSYIQSLQLPNLSEHSRNLLNNSSISLTPSNYKSKNFSTKSPFAISQLIKTNSPTRRRDSENTDDLNEDDDGSTNDNRSGSPDGGDEQMEVEEGMEMSNGDNPNNNKMLTDYAMNTMKELLGIYGLSSNEVADALNGQARDIEAFKAGKSLPLWFQRRWSQGGIGPMAALGNLGNLSNLGNLGGLLAPPPFPEESEARSPFDMHRINAMQDDSAASGMDSDGERTLDLSLAKDHDVQDLSTASSAGNSVAEFEHQTLMMRRNLEDLAGLHGIFSKPPGSMEGEDLSADLRAKLSPAALLASLGQLDAARRQAAAAPTLDYSRYVKRYGSALECGSSYCKDLGYREHFHCLDCSGRVFCKKEEMIRHFKWHKKRDESLVHGFMRYSPLDDCGERGVGCPHNRSQTHYHCIQDGCDKVYISTSDVQMHANYHRKDSAILQEGFQRFRATERCSAPHCAFRGQRTTHFHCRRQGCRYTFKNKADMEKHKTYHIKDEQLARDGFKKYMKNEPCPYRECRFSRMCNHIHCIRPRCNYVLHSSSQLFSHKRKHERKEQELNYSIPSSALQSAMFSAEEACKMKQQPGSPGDEDMRESPSSAGPTHPMDLTGQEHGFDPQLHLNQLVVEEITRKYVHTFAGGTDAGDKCPLCSAFNKHYHCKAEHCRMAHSCHNTMVKHALEHEHQSQVTEACYQTSTKDNPCGSPTCLHIQDETHYHCTWDNCGCVILSSDDQPFRRLEHYRQHTLMSPTLPLPLPPSPMSLSAALPAALLNPLPLPPVLAHHPAPASSLDEMFSRKRGRPPKNRVVEVWADHATPQAVFTSFKLPKTNQTSSSLPPSPINDESMRIRFPNFDAYNAPDACIAQYPTCALRSTRRHAHCTHCTFSTASGHAALDAHAKNAHGRPLAVDGFQHFMSHEDCNSPQCVKMQTRAHFHCVQVPHCQVVLMQYAALLTHKHPKSGADGNDEPILQRSLSEIRDYSMKSMDEGFMSLVKSESPDAETGCVSVVKAAGTFYPLSHERAVTSPPTPTSSVSSTRALSIQTDAGNTDRSSGAFDNAPLGLQATKETLEREYPEISILPSTASSSSPSPSSQRLSGQQQQQQQQRTATQSPSVSQSMHSLLLQQYLVQAAAGAGSKAAAAAAAAAQMPPATEQLKYSQQMGLTASQLAQMAFLTHRSPFPLYPGMMYPPELLMDQAGLQSGLLAAATSSNMTGLDKEADAINKRHVSRGPSNMRMLKDEPIPEGYLRFRFNEDCAYQHCGYREHQTHFHCTRRDCGYSFCDKTRFVQHTARHERLDTLMGGDFTQYRANVFCGRPDCAHGNNYGTPQNKASHFHCLKCDFVCTDTNKVVAHRRQHQKMDSIQAAGFEKFPPSKACGYDPQCIHSKKQTHYHCLQCGFAVLGLSQMTSHKYRHQENMQAGAGTSHNT